MCGNQNISKTTWIFEKQSKLLNLSDSILQNKTRLTYMKKVSDPPLRLYPKIRNSIVLSREEASDARASRMLSSLKSLKYRPPSNSVTDVSGFRQGIVLGEKSVIHPILLYLLTNFENLKTRAYLARFLLKLPVSTFVFDISMDVGCI